MTTAPPMARRIVLAARPNGKPVPSDFRIEEMPIPVPSEGELLLRTLYLSLDPYMRGNMDARESYSPAVPLGDKMRGIVVAEVEESRNADFREGDLVIARSGWATHAISDGAGLTRLDERSGSLASALGVMGMPGFTAYVGLLNIGQPNPGETVVVAAASGPVGSLVGQIARIKGARAIGIAGGPEKCAFVRDELGFDAAIDHRAPDFAAQLAAVCPDGVDVYFENVGGAVWQAVLPLLNNHARVPVCGTIAHYNGTGHAGPDLLPDTMWEIIARRLKLQGFINSDFIDQWARFQADVAGWISEGRVRSREQVVAGLENAPAAFIGMLEGQNFGKLVVEVAPRRGADRSRAPSI